MRRLPILLLLSALFVACSSIDCPYENTISVQYEIRDKAGNALSITDSLSVVTTRLDGENVLLNRLVDKSAFSLPISYSHPEDILFFCFTDTVKTVVDTVWIKKDDIPHFESVDCNVSFFHHLTNVRCTHNYIDSLVIKDPSVNYDQTTVHFYLYPKVSD
jgi:hypothetical protein